MRNLLRTISVMLEAVLLMYMWNLGFRIFPLCIGLVILLTIIMIFIDNDDNDENMGGNVLMVK